MNRRTRTTKPPSYSWAIYHLSSAPAKLLGIIHNQADAYKVPPNERDRLIAQRRD